jgi:hypothetical protein
VTSVVVVMLNFDGKNFVVRNLLVLFVWAL